MTEPQQPAVPVERTITKTKKKKKLKLRLKVVSKEQNEVDEYQQKSIKNKGTGAGGSNTNKNGLPYESLTELNEYYDIIEKHAHGNTIKFKDTEPLFIATKQGSFIKLMDNELDKTVDMAHGCKRPDECYIDKKNKRIFIIEKKFQQSPGSVCEKIQSPSFKIWQYGRMFPEFKIVYIYCLSDWFKENCKSEILYFHEMNYPIFWGNSKTYKEDMVKFLVNYK
tara:strand:+ start:14764 stop:15432 length:669 start_codon:yes stop_codon:yes gene_type:complete